MREKAHASLQTGELGGEVAGAPRRLCATLREGVPASATPSHPSGRRIAGAPRLGAGVQWGCRAPSPRHPGAGLRPVQSHPSPRRPVLGSPWRWPAPSTPGACHPPHHDDHVPELLQQADLLVTSFELLIVWDRDFEQAPGLAQGVHDALHGRDALLLLGGGAVREGVNSTVGTQCRPPSRPPPRPGAPSQGRRQHPAVSQPHAPTMGQRSLPSPPAFRRLLLLIVREGGLGSRNERTLCELPETSRLS